MEVPLGNVIEFKASGDLPDGWRVFERKSVPASCDHGGATYLVDSGYRKVVCSKCQQVVEAIEVLIRLSHSEEYRHRRDNSDACARIDFEQKAEKQAEKTRKAAYATLYRFGVTPEMYAEEYRKKNQFAELESRQDYTQTIAFSSGDRT